MKTNIVLFFSILFALAVLCCQPSLASQVAKPQKEQFPGWQIYQDALKTLASGHNELADAQKRADWMKCWQSYALAHKADFNDRQHTANHIEFMLASLNCKNDAYRDEKAYSQSYLLGSAKLRKFWLHKYGLKLALSRYSIEKHSCAEPLDGATVNGVIGGDNHLVVEYVVPTSPAYKAGLLPGDRLVKVNQRPVAGRQFANLINELYFSKEDKLSLSFVRTDQTCKQGIEKSSASLKALQSRHIQYIGSVYGQACSSRLVVLSAEPSENVVYSAKLGEDTAYVWIKNFESSTEVEQLESALKKLSDCRVLILDLRGNHGGRTRSAVSSIALLTKEAYVLDGRVRYFDSLFNRIETIENGKCHIRDSSADGKVVVESEEILPATVWSSSKPIYILVDESTASSAEIVCGALASSQRARIVGSSRTYGKVHMQHVKRLSPEISLQYTICKFRAGGLDHEYGLKPEFLVEEAPTHSVDHIFDFVFNQLIWR